MNKNSLVQNLIFKIRIVQMCIRDRSHITSAARGGGGGLEMLTVADGGGGGFETC